MGLNFTLSPELYSLILKIGFIAVFSTSLIVVVNAVRSAKAMGGTLGQGLKKVAAGTVAHSILLVTYLMLEKGDQGILTDFQIRIFFITLGSFGSILLISGYYQIYTITKRLKLFTI
jgi:uncharacterized membrane protein